MKLDKILLFPVGKRPSCHYAAQELSRRGIALCDHVSPEVTHLLLDVPSEKDIGDLLRMLPPTTAIIGGNLDHFQREGSIDLLHDEAYLAQNAAITADCALKLAREAMNTTWRDTRVLVLGWGRIGKCLAKDLRALGAEVTVAARKERDRAMAETLGCRAVPIPGPADADIVFNTVPEMVWQHCPIPIKIDLASRKGLGGEDVLWARGLPGIHAPKTTGRLIAQRILAHLKEEKP